jgi:outer membrane receptor protein involved in Fe transport
LIKATNDTCLASSAQLASLISAINASAVDALGPSALLAACAGRYATANPANPLAGLGIFVDPLPSVPVDLTGKELPQSPEFTGSVGAQYTFQLSSSWQMTVRGDYYYQTDSYTRVYNSVSDELKAWDNANMSINFANMDLGLAIQVYGKNLMDDDVITGYSTNSDQLGLTRSATVLDPRLFGVNVTYSFGK